MRDPYEVLGVPKSASAATIKSAFRKLAKKLHPDANKHDQKSAAKFAELNAAYEIVGDDDKRKAFDRGEIDAEGKPRFQGFPGGGPGRGDRAGGRPGSPAAAGRPFRELHLGPGRRSSGPAVARRGGFGGGGIDDILKEMFGGGRARRRRGDGARNSSRRTSAEPRRASDVTGAVTITLPEAATGTSRRVQLPTGKEIDVEDSGRPRRRPDHPAQGAGAAGPRRRGGRRADHRVDRAASDLRARRREPAARTAGHALRGGARRPRCGCRRSTARSSLRFRRGTNRRPHLPPQGQGPAGQGRRRRSLRDRAHHAARRAPTPSSRS